ncbi:CPBP family intramembrane metalloprotease [Lactococcus lactis subsp. lactis]|nr:CPBP family intramembrane metalloprotease [Lactococcus cremoris]MRL67173.1 CPBP family intramembrane metalloprotease [Lactococcus lactis subsp. lactis]
MCCLKHSSFLLNQRIKMHKVFEKIITIFFAFFLFFISQIPIYYVNYKNKENNLYGISNKISLPFIFIALFVIIIAVALGKKRGFYHHSKKTLEFKNIMLILVLVTISIILNILINRFIIFHHLGIMNNQINIDSILSSLSCLGKIFGIALLAPILEESIFRASIYQIFNNDKVSFLISSLLFAFLHSGYSWVFFTYLPVSLCMTFIYHRRKILTDSILFHSLFNLLVLGLNFLI